MTDRLAELNRAGVSIWLDDLSRDRLTSGSLASLVARDHVVGVTTNPAIFAKAISAGAEAYAGRRTSHAQRTSKVVTMRRASSTSTPRTARSCT